MSQTLYTRLDPRKHEIRLVRLYPWQPDAAIKCELLVASMLHPPPYEALSYVWGQSKSNYSIEINGCTAPVTDNLYRALCRLRPLVGIRTLWIDQLCMNQSDHKERGQQVELMGAIYSKSKETLLWLGEEACYDSSDVPPDQMTPPKTRPCTWSWIKDDQDGASHRPLFQAELDIQGQPEYEEDYIYLAISLVAKLATLESFDSIPYISSDKGTGRDVLRALWFIMNRPWWSRVWTLQECVLSPKSVLMYGPVTAPFEMFLLAASTYTSRTISAGSELPQRLPRANATILRHFTQTLIDIDTYRRRQLSGEKIDLISAMRSFRIREATDERDKVYGLLGLDIDWHGQESFYPDYGLTTSQLYLNITLKLIQSTKSLKILINNQDKHGDSRKTGNVNRKPDSLAPPSFVSSELQALLLDIESWKTELQTEPYFLNVGANDLHLPSWVPDWSSRTNFEVLSRYDQAELYSAALTTATTATLSDESILCLRGLEVDTVRWSSQIMAHTGGEDRSSLFETWRAFAVDAVAYNSSNQSDLTPLEDAFWRTLCGDTVQGTTSSPPRSTFHRAAAHNHQDILSWCRFHAPGLLPPSTSTSLPDDTNTSSQRPPPVEDHSNHPHHAIEPAIRAATTMRRLFVTRQGFLGLGPAQTVGREKVFVLYGGQAPFLLRETTDKSHEPHSGPSYELVGDCYVHGIMDGEAMAWNLPETEVLLV